MSSSSFAALFAQLTTAAPSTAAGATDPAQPQGAPVWTMLIYLALFGAMFYFALIRPQSLAKKKQEDTIKGARTGDKIITTSGIHGLITNVKDTTVIVKVAENVKLEIEKTHIDKITRPESATPEKAVAAKA